VTWAAPGRVNLIGEHVDYNDGLVLPFALPWTTVTSATRRDGKQVSVRSDGVGSAQFPVAVAPDDVSGWVAYVAGVVWALRQRDLEVPALELEITSDVPDGAGLSSSAALTCSVACAINDVAGYGLSRPELAESARVAEHDFVGAPTGSMDQLASMLCEEKSALLLDCRSMERRQIRLDPRAAGLVLLLIDTHARHELVGSEYGDRRSDCEAAARELGVHSLRESTPDDLGRLTDARLRRRAEHVVSEIERVAAVAAVLDQGDVAAVGDYLTASHLSLRDDFQVSCEELDVAVDAALSAGALGARMVGGGFGGCVISLCHAHDEPRVRNALAEAYDEHRWQSPTITEPMPSPGAHPL
jgi:galactokinase